MRPRTEMRNKSMRVFLSPRALKRLGIGLAILVAIALITNGLFAWRMNARLQAKFAAIRADGDPASISELAPQAIPDDDNAALTLKRIAPRIKEFGKEQALFYKSSLGIAY